MSPLRRQHHRRAPWGNGKEPENERGLHAQVLEHPRVATGFLSVDPFRLYPGSPIDGERDLGGANRACGCIATRGGKTGIKTSLSEWVDASSDLDYRSAQRLVSELIDPILQALPQRAYTRPA
ncbi:MAG: hypothetical protein R3B07_29725 [Polyangiaceae bacterium]